VECATPLIAVAGRYEIGRALWRQQHTVLQDSGRREQDAKKFVNSVDGIQILQVRARGLIGVNVHLGIINKQK
jgi:hypothetical protein